MRFFNKRSGFNLGLFSILVFLLFFPHLFPQAAYSQSVRWEENFEDEDLYGRGWKYANLDSSGHVPSLLPPHEYVTLGMQSQQSGNYFWRFNFEDANYRHLIDDWLITPKLENIQAGDTFSFWCGSIDRGFKDSLKVWVSVTDNNPSSFTEIDYFKVDGPVGAWHKKSYGLSSYAGQNIYIAVNYYHTDGGGLGTSSDNMWVDHFSLTGPGGSNVEVTSYELAQNFPNPFNPDTEISFSILENTNVSLKVYDTAGNLVSVLINGAMENGRYSVGFSGEGFASGVYFYKLAAGNFTDTKKMILVK